jgi:hypothetical protein
MCRGAATPRERAMIGWGATVAGSAFRFAMTRAQRIGG